MKKQELIKKLNKSADSISLHDGSLIDLIYGEKDGKSNLTFIIDIGSYHYFINNLEKFVDDTESYIILSLTFYGVKDLKIDFCDDLRINNCEIMINESKNNIYRFELLDSPGYGEIVFSYDNFLWDTIEELPVSEIDAWEEKYQKNKYKMIPHDRESN